MARVTSTAADPDLVELLVTSSFDTLKWMRDRRACASPRSTAGRRSRSTASSSSGAASRSRRSAAARAWSIRSPQLAKKAGIEIWYGARALDR
jgi:hypothetical protein